MYVLRNSQDRLYIGFTADLERRVEQHQSGKGGWTRGGGPWQLVHHEEFSDRAEALSREKKLKTGRANQELRERFAKTSE